MLFGLRIPQPPLSFFVENFWFYEGYSVDHRMERLLPDGAIELIIDLTDTTKHIYSGADFHEIQSVNRSWISGQHSGHIVIQTGQNASMIGVRFRPGGLYPFLQFPVSELNDSVINLDFVWKGFIREIRDRILEAPTPGMKFDILQEMLFRKAAAFEPDRTLNHVIRQITEQTGNISVKALAADTGISHRQLIRKFDGKVGLKPKALARVYRFNSVLRRVHGLSEVEWSSVANDCGYFDQSHFIHEFQELTGMAPSQYLLDKTEYPNFVPVRET